MGDNVLMTVMHKMLKTNLILLFFYTAIDSCIESLYIIIDELFVWLMSTNS